MYTIIKLTKNQILPLDNIGKTLIKQSFVLYSINIFFPQSKIKARKIKAKELELFNFGAWKFSSFTFLTSEFKVS